MSLVKIEDALGEASGFAYAIRMAASDMSTREGIAIDLIADQIDERLRKALSMIDKMRGAGDAVSDR